MILMIVCTAGFKIRADAESLGFCETFRVYCQARFKRKAKMSKKEVVDASGVELDNMYVLELHQLLYLKVLILFSNVIYVTVRNSSHGEVVAIWAVSRICESSKGPKNKEIYQRHYWIVEVK